MKDGPQYSGAVERCATPGSRCATPGSMLISPAGTPTHLSNSTSKSYKLNTNTESTKPAALGRIKKVRISSDRLF